MKTQMIPIVVFVLSAGVLFGQVESGQLLVSERASAPDEKPWLIQADPSFPGGSEALRLFFFPVLESAEATLRLKAWEGEIFLTAYLDRYGQVTDARIVNCPDEGLEQRLRARTLDMPRWNPGIQAGRPVPSRVAVPLEWQFNRP